MRPLRIPAVQLVTPKLIADARGYFMEVWHADEFARLGVPARFVQINQSSSRRGTLRGLHYQVERPQGKLVRVVSGRIFDVAVDLRKSQPTFGEWAGEFLSAAERNMLWIPPGFAHGFYVISAEAEIEYCCTTGYAPDLERAIAWNDPDLAIAWPLDAAVPLLLSDKDRCAGSLRNAEVYP